MPKKVNKVLINQSKTIKTRLMQISMTLDDFIYKSKPISPAQAEMYIAEVGSYKAICQKDLRSLQVIEKLTNCMKKIISEEAQCESIVENVYAQNNAHTSVSTNNYNIQNYVTDNLNNTQYTCLSPTYSITSDTVVLHEEDPKINRPSVEEDIAEIEIVELRDDVAIEKSMTSLTILETPATQQAIENDTVNSQSILTDYVGYDSEIIDLETGWGQNMKEYFKDKYEETKAGVNKVTNSVDKAETKKVDVKQNNTEETSIKGSKRKIATKRNKAKSTKNDSQVLNPRQESLIDSNKSIDHSNNISKDLPNATTALKRSGPAKKTPKKRKDKVFVEDLSWIENIKYVRVVDVEEFDPNLNNLSETFWDKFCLPPVWDDRDFEY